MQDKHLPWTPASEETTAHPLQSQAFLHPYVNNEHSARAGKHPEE